MYFVVNASGYEVLDSRGSPTIEVSIAVTDETGNLVHAFAAAPSGASCGKREAIELRDNDSNRYFGKGVTLLFEKIKEIMPVISKTSFTGISDFDNLLIQLDGTEQKSNLGGNLITAMSFAFAKALAKIQKLDLWQAIRREISLSSFWADPRSSLYRSFRSMNFNSLMQDIAMPRLMINILNGGSHADNKLSFQEFMIVPRKEKIADNLRIASEIFHQLKKDLQSDNYRVNTGDEGGFAPDLEAHHDAFEYIDKAAKKINLRDSIDISIDAASSGFFLKQGQEAQTHGVYSISGEKLVLNHQQLSEYYLHLIQNYKLASIEDPFNEDSFKHWEYFVNAVNEKIHDITGGYTDQEALKNFMIIGDDISTTNAKMIDNLAKHKLINAVIIKPNQIGTLTEALIAVDVAKFYNLKVIASHRSGETEDSWISDFAIAVEAEFLKAGSVCRSDRTSKYNRLLRIEHRLRVN